MPPGKERCELLCETSRDFAFAADRFGRIILAEQFLSDDAKTIKPARSLGGRAGGDKYIVGGILFKVVNPDDGPYQGNYEAASKAAGHDLKGCQHMLRCRRQFGIDISVALQVVVTYHGFRLQAQAMLPLTHTSLRMGTRDGGHTVLASDAALMAKMAGAAAVLNLAEHSVRCYGYGSGDGSGSSDGSGSVRLFTGGDVEGHLGSDGRHYVLDLARTFPPEAVPCTPHLPYNPRAVFWRLLRPEFVLLRGYGARNSVVHQTTWEMADVDFRSTAADAAAATHPPPHPAAAATVSPAGTPRQQQVAAQEQLQQREGQRERIDLKWEAEGERVHRSIVGSTEMWQRHRRMVQQLSDRSLADEAEAETEAGTETLALSSHNSSSADQHDTSPAATAPTVGVKSLPTQKQQQQQVLPPPLLPPPPPPQRRRQRSAWDVSDDDFTSSSWDFGGALSRRIRSDTDTRRRESGTSNGHDDGGINSGSGDGGSSGGGTEHLPSPLPPPLSSDGFTGFSAGQRDSTLHNDRLRAATEHLVRHTVPALAARLYGSARDRRGRGMSAEEVVQHIHAHGVNMRHLGLLLWHILKVEAGIRGARYTHPQPPQQTPPPGDEAEPASAAPVKHGEDTATPPAAAAGQTAGYIEAPSAAADTSGRGRSGSGYQHIYLPHEQPPPARTTATSATAHAAAAYIAQPGNASGGEVASGYLADAPASAAAAADGSAVVAASTAAASTDGNGSAGHPPVAGYGYSDDDYGYGVGYAVTGLQQEQQETDAGYGLQQEQEVAAGPGYDSAVGAAEAAGYASVVGTSDSGGLSPRVHAAVALNRQRQPNTSRSTGVATEEGGEGKSAAVNATDSSGIDEPSYLTAAAGAASAVGAATAGYSEQEEKEVLLSGGSSNEAAVAAVREAIAAAAAANQTDDSSDSESGGGGRGGVVLVPLMAEDGKSVVAGVVQEQGTGRVMLVDPYAHGVAGRSLSCWAINGTQAVQVGWEESHSRRSRTAAAAAVAVVGGLQPQQQQPQPRDEPQQCQRLSHIVMCELLCRALKQQLRQYQRDLIRSQRTLVEYRMRSLVVDFFNLALGQHAKAAAFRSHTVRRAVRQRFGACALQHGLCSHRFMTDGAHKRMMFMRLRDMMAIEFAPGLEDVVSRPGFRFGRCDVVRIGAAVKDLNIVDFAEGLLIGHEAVQLGSTPGNEPAVSRLYQLGFSMFDRALNAIPNDSTVCNGWYASLMRLRAMQLRDRGRWMDPATEHRLLPLRSLWGGLLRIVQRTRSFPTALTLAHAAGVPYRQEIVRELCALLADLCRGEFLELHGSSVLACRRNLLRRSFWPLFTPGHPLVCALLAVKKQWAEVMARDAGKQENTAAPASAAGDCSIGTSAEDEGGAAEAQLLRELRMPPSLAAGGSMREAEAAEGSAHRLTLRPPLPASGVGGTNGAGAGTNGSDSDNDYSANDGSAGGSVNEGSSGSSGSSGCAWVVDGIALRITELDMRDWTGLIPGCLKPTLLAMGLPPLTSLQLHRILLSADEDAIATGGPAELSQLLRSVRRSLLQIQCHSLAATPLLRMVCPLARSDDHCLRQFMLTNIPFAPAEFPGLATVLWGLAPKLTHLRLAECNVGNDLLTAILPALKQATNLQCLDLSCNTLDCVGVRQLTTAVARMPHLMRLVLKGSKPGAVALQLLLTSVVDSGASKQLLDLDLSDIDLCADAAYQVAALLPYFPAIRILHLNGIVASGDSLSGLLLTLSTSLPKLGVLTLSLRSQKSGDCLALASSVKNLRTLVEMRISNSALGLPAVQNLTDSLCQATQMTTIKLPGCNLGPEAGYLISEMLCHLPHLQSLVLDRNPMGCDAALAIIGKLQLLPGLTDLGFDHIELGDVGAVALAEVLPAIPGLTQLDLRGAGMTYVGSRAIVRQLPLLSRLQFLLFSDNYLGDHCVVADFAQALPFLPRLVHLVLSGCGISVKGILKLLHSMSVLCHLTLLDLSRNPIGADSVHMLLDQLSYIPQLRELVLRRTSLGRAGADAICDHIQKFPSVRLIHVSESDVTPEGVANLQRVRLSTCNTLPFPLWVNVGERRTGIPIDYWANFQAIV